MSADACLRVLWALMGLGALVFDSMSPLQRRLLVERGHLGRRGPASPVGERAGAERHDAPAPAAPGDAGPVHAGQRLQFVAQASRWRGSRVVVVPQACGGWHP